MERNHSYNNGNRSWREEERSCDYSERQRRHGDQVQEILPKRIVRPLMDDGLKHELLAAAQRRLRRVGITMEEMEVPSIGSRRERLPSGPDIRMPQSDHRFQQKVSNERFPGYHPSMSRTRHEQLRPPPPNLHSSPMDRLPPVPPVDYKDFSRAKHLSPTSSIESRGHPRMTSREPWMDQLPHPPPYLLRAQGGRNPPITPPPPMSRFPPPPNIRPPPPPPSRTQPINNGPRNPAPNPSRIRHPNPAQLPRHPRAQSVKSASSGTSCRTWNSDEGYARSVSGNDYFHDDFNCDMQNYEVQPQSSRVKADFYSILDKFNSGQANNSEQYSAQSY